jgi:hypothetical protein
MEPKLKMILLKPELCSEPIASPKIKIMREFMNANKIDSLTEDWNYDFSFLARELKNIKNPLRIPIFSDFI